MASLSFPTQGSGSLGEGRRGERGGPQPPPLGLSPHQYIRFFVSTQSPCPRNTMEGQLKRLPESPGHGTEQGAAGTQYTCREGSTATRGAGAGQGLRARDPSTVPSPPHSLLHGASLGAHGRGAPQPHHTS